MRHDWGEDFASRRRGRRRGPSREVLLVVAVVGLSIWGWGAVHLLRLLGILT